MTASEHHPSTESLSELWTQHQPQVDLKSGAPNLSYRASRSLSMDTTLGASSAATIAMPGGGAGAELGSGLRMLERIGEGGMGVVYRARQGALSRDVAVKTLRRGGDRGRFIQEAGVTAALEHPNIVPVYDLQPGEEDELLLAMKLIGGRPWSEALAADRPWENPGRRAEHLDVLLKVCDALAFAHSRGIFHCDLKPENIMLGEYGEVLVLDWGLAVEEPQEDRPSRAMSREDFTEPSGTPSYMAPELAQGRGSDIGPWTDTYLLGGCLTELLTGAPPHQGRTLLAVLESAMTGPPPVFPDSTPGELRAIAEKALSKAPEQRFASARALKEAIQDYQRHSESIALAEAARRDLERSERDERDTPASAYTLLSKAVSGFEQALVLWAENREAREGRARALTLSAERALATGDLGLAESQIEALKAAGAPAAELREALMARREARDRGRRRQTIIRRALAGSIATIVLGLSVGFALVKSSADAARAAEAETRSALEESRQNLRRAYVVAGRYYLSSGDHASAELMIAQSLAGGDSQEGRQALLEARLPNLGAWRYAAYAEQDFSRVCFSEDDTLLAVTWRKSRRSEPTSISASVFALGGRRLREPVREVPGAWANAILFVGDDLRLRRFKRWTDDKGERQRSEDWFDEAGRKLTEAEAASCEEASNRRYREGFESARFQIEKGGRGQRSAVILKAAPGESFDLGLHLDGGWLFGGDRLYGYGEGALVAWDLTRRSRLWSVPIPRRHRREGMGMDLSSDGRFLATRRSGDHEVRVWRAEDGAALHRFRFQSAIVNFEFAHRRNLLAIATRRGLHVREFRDRHHVMPLPKVEGGARGLHIHGRCDLFTRGGAHLDLDAGRTLSRLAERERFLDFDPAGQVAAIASDGGVILRRLESGEDLVALPSEGAMIDEAELDALIIERAKRRGSQTLVESFKALKEAGGLKSMKALLGLGFYSGGFTPDGRRFVGVGRFLGCVWDARSGAFEARFEGTVGRRFDFALSADGTRVAVIVKGTRKESRVKIWELPSGRLLREFEVHRYNPSRIAFSPKGRDFIAVTQDGASIGRWSCEGEKRYVLEDTPHRDDLLGLAFSADGRSFITGDNYGLVCFWEAESGRLLGQLQAHKQSVWGIAASPDGRFLVTGSAGGLIKRWDARFIWRVLRDASGPELFEESQRRLGLDLDEVLALAR